MTVKLFNTASGKLEDFNPIEDGRVSMYTCGPTVYDYPHIGNWFGYVAWDILIRLLSHEGYDVNRVMNLTDVGHLTGDNEGDADTGDDKLAKKAANESKSAWEIAEYFSQDFITQMNNLNMIKPSRIAKATDYIEQQLELIRILKEKGYTYQISDGIYFDTSKFPRYADFAKLDLDALRAGARVKFNNEKRNHSDFALWKFSPEGESRDMEWSTPNDLLDSHDTDDAVMGFPGWHLECSAIVMSTLGETIDIHTGGIDHIPVHHTNEIAQSEAATDKKFSNFWLHNNHIKSNGTKLSKSLGNGYSLQDLLKLGFSALDYRMFAIQSHYRSEANFSIDNLQAAHNRLHNWRNVAALRHQTHDTIDNDDDKDNDDTKLSLYAASKAIVESLEDDLDTPKALVIIDEAFSKLIKAKPSNIHQHSLVQLLETIDELLGINLVKTTPDIEDDMKREIIHRQHIREAQNWKESDKIRSSIEKNGITVRDTVHGPVWEYL